MYEGVAEGVFGRWGKIKDYWKEQREARWRDTTGDNWMG